MILGPKTPKSASKKAEKGLKTASDSAWRGGHVAQAEAKSAVDRGQDFVRLGRDVELEGRHRMADASSKRASKALREHEKWLRRPENQLKIT